MITVEYLYHFSNDKFLYIIGLLVLLCLLIGITNAITKRYPKAFLEKRSTILSILFYSSLGLLIVLTVAVCSFAEKDYYANGHATHIGVRPYTTLKSIPAFILGVDVICLLAFINELRLIIRFGRESKKRKII